MTKNSPPTRYANYMFPRRFGLKGLMIVVVLIGCVFAWAGGRYRQSLAEQATLRKLADAFLFPNLQIDVWYQSQKTSVGEYAYVPTTPATGLFKWLIGNPFAFERVTKVAISSPPIVRWADGRTSIVVVSEQSENSQDYVRLSILRNLNRLDAIELSIDDLDSLEGLSKLKSLREITLIGCLAIKNVDELAGLTNLSRLRIHGCHSLENLDGILGLKQLTRVEIFRCDSLPAETVEHFKALRIGSQEP